MDVKGCCFARTSRNFNTTAGCLFLEYLLYWRDRGPTATLYSTAVFSRLAGLMFLECVAENARLCRRGQSDRPLVACCGDRSFGMQYVGRGTAGGRCDAYIPLLRHEDH